MDSGEHTPQSTKVGARRKDFKNFDSTSAPKDYEALWVDYFDYACSYVRRLGIASWEVEDTAMLIFLRFEERGFLDKFDPTMHRRHRGVMYRTSFQKFFEVFVEHYVRGIRDKHHRLRSRELIICDSATPTGDIWIEVHGPTSDEDPTRMVWGSEVVARVREQVALVPPRNVPGDKRDLLRLFDMTMDHVTYGVDKQAIRNEDKTWTVVDRDPTSVWQPDRKLMAAEFGVSDSAIGSWLAELRRVVAEALVKIDPVEYGRFAGGV